MKNGKFAKILVLALSLALLIGSAVGIAASASTDSTGEIYAQSIVHDDKIQIAFAVDATADEVLAGTVALEYYFDGATANTKTAALYVDSNGDAVLKDGKVVLVTEGVSAQDLTSVVTATTYVDGEAKATKTYSVAKFLFTKLYKDFYVNFSSDTTTDVEKIKYKELYQSLITYSAKAQAIFDPDEPSISDYFFVNYNDGSENSFEIYSEAFELTLPNTVSIENGTFNNAWFVQTSVDNNVESADQTFTKVLSGETITVSSNTVLTPVFEIEAGSGKYYNDANVSGTKLSFDTATDKEENIYWNWTDTKCSTEVVDNSLVSTSTGWGGFSIKSNDANTYSSGKYVFEADVTINSITNSRTNLDWAFAGFLMKDAENTTNNECFEVATLYTNSDNNSSTLFNTDIHIATNVRYNLRLEYDMTTNMTELYVNNVKAGSFIYSTSNTAPAVTDYNNSNTAFDGFTFYFKGKCTMTFDNVYLGVINGVVAE